MNRRNISLFIRLSRPHFLLGAALLYALGVSIAHYLGATIDWSLYLLGQAWGTMVQLSAHYLNEYFDSSADAENPNRTLFSGGSGALGEGKLPREVAFWAAIFSMAMAASFTALILRDAHPSAALILVMVLIFLGAFFYSTPPIRLASSGYGELTTTVIVANLVPTMGYLLQHGELHRLVAMVTFPLTALHLAMMLAFELPDYASDIKYQKRTLMVRLGWERGMALHNGLILCSYVLVGIAMVSGLPLTIAVPMLLTLPLGIFSIWSMNRIADGRKPNWKVLTFTAASLFGVAAYLATFTFWIR